MNYLLSIYDIRQYPPDFMQEYKRLDSHGLIKGCEFYIPEPLGEMRKIAKDFKEMVFQIHAMDLDNMDIYDIFDMAEYYHDLAEKSEQRVNVIIHPLISVNPESGMYQTLQRLYTLQNHIDQHGLYLDLLVENLNPLNNIKRCEVSHIKQILDELSVWFCWDIGHDKLCGNHSYTLPLKNAMRLKNVHLHDVHGPKDHCPFYSGRTILGLDYLKSIGYNGNMVLEIALDYLNGDTLHEKQIKYVEQFELVEAQNEGIDRA